MNNPPTNTYWEATGTPNAAYNIPTANVELLTRGKMRYELTDHLGNVRSVISDRKLAKQNGTTLYFEVEIVAAQDYYPFGMLMPGRQYANTAFSDDYRYGFNGQEQDDEVYGAGNSTTAEYWQYDARLGRRWNIDPIEKEFCSNYIVFGNNPILFIDPNGADWYKNKYGDVYWFDGSHKEISSIPVSDDLQAGHTEWTWHAAGNQNEKPSETLGANTKSTVSSVSQITMPNLKKDNSTTNADMGVPNSSTLVNPSPLTTKNSNTNSGSDALETASSGLGHLGTTASNVGILTSKVASSSDVLLVRTKGKGLQLYTPKNGYVNQYVNTSTDISGALNSKVQMVGNGITIGSIIVDGIEYAYAIGTEEESQKLGDLGFNVGLSTISYYYPLVGVTVNVALIMGSTEQMQKAYEDASKRAEERCNCDGFQIYQGPTIITNGN